MILLSVLIATHATAISLQRWLSSPVEALRAQRRSAFRVLAAICASNIGEGLQ